MDKSLNRVFQLAFFIHGDRVIAADIVTEALDKLDAASAAQFKRLYYEPAGRPSPQPGTNRFRRRVSLSDLHLLQRLIYIESEPHEKKQEQLNNGTGVNEEDMIIRFIKHLVRITTRRNSFYVSLGVNRLLYNYSTAEAMEIYNLVVQDPDRVKDDYYYRSRKKQLMEELKERFGPFLKVIRVHRGEERFQPEDNPNRWAGVVRKSLDQFTPWETDCVVPDGFNRFGEELLPLSFQDDNPDKEHPIEVNRIHSVLHPDCYGRLIDALNFDSPEQRLAVPQFVLAKGQDDMGGPRSRRHELPELSEEEMIGIQTQLTERAVRRKAASAGWLSIMVDGIERARLDLHRARRVQFDVPPTAELIEVRGHDKQGDLLLATHLLTYDETRSDDPPMTSSIVLEGGQKISFTVSLAKNFAAEITGAVVEVAYEETEFVRAAVLRMQRLRSHVSSWARPEVGGYSPILKPALAFVILAATAAALWLYFQLGQEPAKQPLIAEHAPPTVDREASPLPPQRGEPTPAGTDVAKQRNEKAAPPVTEVARGRDAASNPTLTRAPKLGASAKLLAVKRIHVEPLGDDPLSRHVRDTLISQLQTSGRFTVTEAPDDADAVLRGDVRQGPRGGQMSVRLVNVAGDVIWTTVQSGSGQERQAVAAVMSAKVVKSLLKEIHRLERADVKRQQP
jgi:hypothetical protein